MHDVAQGGSLWGLGLQKEVELNRLSETPTAFFHGTGPSWPCLGARPCDWLWMQDVCGPGVCRGLTVGLPSWTPSAITSQKELPAGGLSRRSSAVDSPGPGLPLPLPGPRAQLGWSPAPPAQPYSAPANPNPNPNRNPEPLGVGWRFLSKRHQEPTDTRRREPQTFEADLM